MFTKTSRSTTADETGRKLRRGRPSAALIVSSLALFSALGGGAYAASTIGSAQIKNNSVQGADIKNGTIKSADIAKGTINALKGAKGPAGAPGAPGAPGQQGAPGTPGAKGDAGATNVSVVRTDLSIAAGTTGFGYASCPAGAKATGGGVGTASSNPTDVLLTSGPVIGDDGLFADTTTGTVPTAWYGRYRNNGGVERTVYIWVICAAP